MSGQHTLECLFRLFGHCAPGHEPILKTLLADDEARVELASAAARGLNVPPKHLETRVGLVARSRLFPRHCATIAEP